MDGFGDHGRRTSGDILMWRIRHVYDRLDTLHWCVGVTGDPGSEGTVLRTSITTYLLTYLTLPTYGKFYNNSM